MSIPTFPPVNIIVIEDHPISQMYYRKVLPSWKSHNIKPVVHKATTPIDLVYRNTLSFGLKTTNEKRDFTATEKAVWYSHFDLWCKCIRKGPMIIVEHDSKILKPLPDLKEEGYKLLSFSKADGKVRETVGSGYYITPPFAERLIARAVATPITCNSDGHISSIMNTKAQQKMKDYFYIEQIVIDGLNTIDHKTTKRNYVGLDYENIDIPSLHR